MSSQNPFDQFDNSNPFDQLDAPQQSTQPEPSGFDSFLAGVEAFNRQFGRMAEGTIDLVTGGAPSIRAVHDQNEAHYAQTVQKHPVATTVGAISGAIGSGVAFAAPAIVGGGAVASSLGILPKLSAAVQSSGMLGKMAMGATGGAAMSYVDYAPTQQERLEKAAIGGTVGAAIPPLFAVGKKAVDMLTGAGKSASGLLTRIFKPEKAALEELSSVTAAEVGDSADELARRAAVAKTAGVPTLTPAQTIGGTRLRAVESTLAVPETEKLGIIRHENQINQITSGKLDEVIGAMAPAGTKAKMKEAYAGIKDAVIPTADMDELMKNPSIRVRLEQMSKEADSTVAKLPMNSTLKLDVLKQNIDDQMFKDTFTTNVETKLAPDARNALNAAHAQIVQTIDKTVPEYATARKLAQQVATRARYEELLARKGANVGNLGVKGPDEIYNTLFSSPDKVEFFLNDVAKTGGNPEQASALAQVFDRLRKSPLQNVLKSTATGDATHISGRDIGVIQSFFNNMINGRYNKAYLNLTLSGDKWVKQVSDVLSMPPESVKQIKAMHTLFGIAAKGAGRAASVEAARTTE